MLVAAARRVSRAVAPLPGRILLSEAFFATRSLSAAAKTEVSGGVVRRIDIYAGSSIPRLWFELV